MTKKYPALVLRGTEHRVGKDYIVKNTSPTRSLQPLTNLFGEPLAASADELPAQFVRHVRLTGHGEFNAWRVAQGFLKVPRWIGAKVEHACRGAGFIQYGHGKATAPASRSRIVGIWRDPRGGTSPKLDGQAVRP